MQNVFIINFNSLYEILDEIKENLSFKIIKFENEDDFVNYFDFDKSNSLIISQNNQKFIANNNFLSLNNLPQSLNKLLELINILFKIFFIFKFYNFKR